MSFFLPSEMGRLIYGYLRTSGSEQLAEEFLNTSDAMKECRRYRHIGFDVRVHDRTLTQMLNEYSLLCDLIFENCPESDRSHLGIVNKLQHLLKSRQRSTEVHLLADTPPCGTPAGSDGSPAGPAVTSLVQTLNDTLNCLQEKDPALRLPSPSKSSKSSPSENAISASCTAATISNVEVPAVSESPSKHSYPITPARTLADEDHSSKTPSAKASPFKNIVTLGIARSTTPAKTPSSLKLAKKSGDHHSTPVASGARSPRVAVSPININIPSTPEKSLPRGSPLQNLSHDVIDINDVSVTSMNLAILSAPTTPVKSNTVRERRSSQKVATPTKRPHEDRTPERKKETPAATPINLEEIPLVQLPATNSSKKPKKSAETKSSGTGAKTSCAVLRSPKPAVKKILPKVPEYLKKYAKSHSPSKKKNTVSEPDMEWDTKLRQFVVDGTESADGGGDDASKKERKNRARKDRDAAVASSKTESNEKKDDKSTIVCKKKRTPEEAKRAREAKRAKKAKEENIAETSVNESTRASGKGAHSSEVVPDKNVRTKKPAAAKTSEARTSKGVAAVPVLPTPVIVATDGCDLDDENDFMLRQKISEEIVLYHKDARAC